MANWFHVGGAFSGVTYAQHLRGEYRAAVSSQPVVDALSASTREICGQFESVDKSIQGLTAAVDQNTAVMHWGFSAVLSQLSGMATTLEELKEMGRNQGKTKAYEHFADARGRFERNQFPEMEFPETL